MCQANPGKVTMASGGVGSGQHAWGELFKVMTGIDLLHVPYRGGAPALADLLAGPVSVMFDTLVTSIELVRSGKLRGLGVASAHRSAVLPASPHWQNSYPDMRPRGGRVSGRPGARP